MSNELGWLADLDDHELLRAAQLWCVSERTAIARVVTYLAEIEERRLHHRFGYPSMIAFCEGHLKMSKSAAYRRLVAARLTRQCPSIPDRLERGDLTLFALNQLKDHLTAATTHLLDEVKDLNNDRLEEFIAERFPKPDVPARIEQAVGPLAKDRFKLQLTISRELRDKMWRAVDLMGHRNRAGGLEVVLEASIDALLTKLERQRYAKPARGEAGATMSKPSAEQSDDVAEPGAQSTLVPTAVDAEPADVEASLPDDAATMPDLVDVVLDATRADERPEPSDIRTASQPFAVYKPPPASISRSARRAVFFRDGEECTFVGAGGRRCSSRVRLEIDHVVPRAQGGSGTVDNLRVLCSAHNAYEARTKLGKDVVERAIEAARRNPPKKK